MALGTVIKSVGMVLGGIVGLIAATGADPPIFALPFTLTLGVLAGYLPGFVIDRWWGLNRRYWDRECKERDRWRNRANG